MKRIFSVLLVLLLCLSALSFAAAETDVTGTWRLTAAESGDLSLEPAMLGLDWFFVLYDDGNCLFNANGDEVTIPWTMSGTQITLHGYGAPIIVDLEGDKLVINQNDVRMVFTREASAADAELPEGARADADADDFAGTWVATTVDISGIEIDMASTGLGLTLEIKGDTVLTTATNEDGSVDKATDRAEYKNGACIVLPPTTQDEPVTCHLLEDGRMTLAQTVDGVEVRYFFTRETRTHIVSRGESLASIAAMYGCTVQDLIALNRDLIKNPSVIYAGWELVLP